VPTSATRRVSSSSRRVQRAGLDPPFELDEAKLRVPDLRRGIVVRVALVERLLASQRQPAIAVVAPAGYGKSTLLAQWAARRHPRVAWISVDDRDNDPTVLLAYLAAALDRVQRIEPTLFRPRASIGAGVADVARLASSIAAIGAPIVLVLDQVEALTNAECKDMIAELILRLPSGSQVAMGSRHEVPVPVPRLRAEGNIIEIGVADLAMDTLEAGSLLSEAGVELEAGAVEDLVERTEGWPAGLYLAALAMNAGSVNRGVEFVFTGADRFMGDYLRTEFLDHVSRRDVTFLTRTSILDRLSGPLCDVTVGRQGSGRLLDRMQRTNLLVIPLDRVGQWYRYHQLFRELLHAELLQREPETIPELHTRAASWYEANNLPEAAIEHAQQARDADRVERLVLNIANQVWVSGRLDTVLRWMEWFASEGAIEDHPAVAVHGSLIYALVGKASDAERWAIAAERSTLTGMLDDGNTMEGTLAYLRTLLCRRGLDEMRRDARLALDGLSPTSPYRPAMLHAEAVADLLQGETDRAARLFASAADEAASSEMTPFVALLLAERGIIAIQRGAWPEADALASQALALVHDGRFDDYWTSALVFAWGARVAFHRGEVERARDLVQRAARLRTLLTYALPIVSVQALLELARAYIALADPGGAQAVLGQIDDIRQHRPDLGTLHSQADELRSAVQVIKGEMLGLSSLTTAELRLLPLLPSHLSLAEIGERLFISRNTVKTHLISLYRKLGVSNRRETIARMHELGLIGEA
jgi:LuxR family transcriptional regulator, maltose regulon positive regulatory protein